MTKYLFFILLVISNSQAEVIDTLSYNYYGVVDAPGQSLRLLLNEASPIRENNQTFHGYTKWAINWNFWWDADDEGRCRITSSKTTLTTTVTLPKLSRGNVEQQSQFNRYSLSLKQHELGHYQIGREAAAVIDRMFVSLPAMQDCQILEKTANDTAYQKLETFKAKERLYDTDTEYGKTQGAWLEN